MLYKYYKKNLFTRLHDKIKINDESSNVYCIPCENCDGCYIGQTKQLLKKELNNINYYFCENHSFVFKNVKILDREPNYAKGLVSDMMNIKIQEKSINKKTDINYLSKIYKNLLNKHQQSTIRTILD